MKNILKRAIIRLQWYRGYIT